MDFLWPFVLTGKHSYLKYPANKILDPNNRRHNAGYQLVQIQQ